MKQVTSQRDLDTLIAIPHWENAFLRESYLLSPSCKQNEYEELAEACNVPNMKVLVCTTDLECPGIEFAFVAVEKVGLSFNCDLSPKGKYNEDCITFSFTGSNFTSILCKSIYFRLLGKECWGRATRYGLESIFDEANLLNSKILEG